VNLLLDSYTLLWLMQDDPNLSRAAVKLIASPSNTLHLSIASIWEIGIKSGIGKLRLAVPFESFLMTAINGYGLVVVPIPRAIASDTNSCRSPISCIAIRSTG
jgi:PIN domain nuclease of toxin-antitoxin system